MTVPDEVFSCCCDWGFEFIRQTVPVVWYMSEGNSGAATERLEAVIKSDGTTHLFSAFTDASRIQAMATLSDIPYFYAYFILSTASTPDIKKYDLQGSLIWTYSADSSVRHSQPGGTGNTSHRIAVDDSGNVYLVGTTGAAGSRQMVVNKIDPDGNEVWSQSVSHHGGSGDYWGLFVAVDVDGNVAAVGTGGVTYFDSDGNEQWGDAQGGYKVCFDASGNLYILSFENPPSVWSYDSTGAFRFSQSLTGASSLFFTDIEIFDSMLYAAWYSSVSTKVFLSRRSDATFSTVDWSVEIPYTNSFTVGPRVAVDESGDLYAAYSTIDASLNRFGYFTRRAAASGAEVYSDDRSVECLNPMIPPGRPPIFI